jgi:hypothetical protein
MLDLTDGKGVHAVYDGVGKDTFDEDFEVVRSRGTLVMYGNASVSHTFLIAHMMLWGRVQADGQGAPAEFSVLRLSPKSLKITRPTLGAFISTPEDFASYSKEVLDWIKDGHLKVSRLCCCRMILMCSSRLGKSTRSLLKEFRNHRLIFRLGVPLESCSSKSRSRCSTEKYEIRMG